MTRGLPDPTRPATSRLERVDPTRAVRWARMQDGRARARFVVLYGVLACGIPLALLTDLYALTRHGEWDIFFSLRHAVQLHIALLLVAPTAGAVAGRALLRLGDRRYAAEALKRAFAVEEEQSFPTPPPALSDQR